MSGPVDEDGGVLCCSLCGRSSEGRRWIILNRYALGTGERYALTESRTEDEDGEQEYFWNQAFEAGEQNLVSGNVLCWPDCAFQWIEGKMIALDANLELG